MSTPEQPETARAEAERIIAEHKSSCMGLRCDCDWVSVVRALLAEREAAPSKENAALERLRELSAKWRCMAERANHHCADELDAALSASGQEGAEREAAPSARAVCVCPAPEYAYQEHESWCPMAPATKGSR